MIKLSQTAGSVVDLHTRPDVFLWNIKQSALDLRLLPCATLRAFRFSSEETVRYAFDHYNNVIFSAAGHLLMVEMKSKKRSLGKRGFSSPLKYSFNTPATELMSWSFWSSINGSSPEYEKCMEYITDEKYIYSIIPCALSYNAPLSNEFLMSLTSTCEPGTRNMPCCCKPKINKTGIQYNSKNYLHTQESGLWKQT